MGRCSSHQKYETLGLALREPSSCLFPMLTVSDVQVRSARDLAWLGTLLGCRLLISGESGSSLSITLWIGERMLPTNFGNSSIRAYNFGLQYLIASSVVLDVISVQTFVLSLCQVPLLMIRIRIGSHTMRGIQLDSVLA